MKKAGLFFIVLLLASSLSGFSFKNDYISRQFPSDAILLNATENLGFPSIQKVVGKAQTFADHYIVFFEHSNENLCEMRLIKLDNNAWILSKGSDHFQLQE